jgi:AcrR family transcriptional regulator
MGSLTLLNKIMKDNIFSEKDREDRNVRERILHTATRLFYLRGTEHTGINQIIAESKVAKASFYQYFPSKEDLVIACLDVYNRAIMGVLVRVIEKSETFTDFFKRWTRLIKESIGKGVGAFNGCPIANIGFQVDPDNRRIKNRIREISAEWQETLRPLYKRSVARGECHAQRDFSALFRQIIQINEGAFIMWRLTGDDAYIDGLLPAFIALIASA